MEYIWDGYGKNVGWIGDEIWIRNGTGMVMGWDEDME